MQKKHMERCLFTLLVLLIFALTILGAISRDKALRCACLDHHTSRVPRGIPRR